MSPRHIDTGERGIACRLANALRRPLTYLRDVFVDEEDASFQAWVREQRRRHREGRR